MIKKRIESGGFSHPFGKVQVWAGKGFLTGRAGNQKSSKPVGKTSLSLKLCTKAFGSGTGNPARHECFGCNMLFVL